MAGAHQCVSRFAHDAWGLGRGEGTRWRERGESEERGVVCGWDGGVGWMAQATLIVVLVVVVVSFVQTSYHTVWCAISILQFLVSLNLLPPTQK